MGFARRISSASGLVLCGGRGAHGLGEMTRVTSSGMQRINLAGALKRRLSAPRYLIAGHWMLQLVIVLVFIFFQGLNTPHGLVTLQLAPERMAQIFGFGDSGSYLKAAFNLVATGHNTPQGTPEWAWVLNLWPPGMVWLDAVIIRFSPLDYGVTIGLITALLWSTTLSLLTWPFMRAVKPALVVLLVELVILGTSPFQSWMFDEGLFYADGLAAGSFLLGMALIANRVRSAAPAQVWIRDGIYAGIAFAAAVYLRASYQLVPWALAALALGIAGMIIVKRIRGLPSGDLGRQAILLVAAALTIPLLMQPYTAYLQQVRGRSQFVTTQELSYAAVWKSQQLDSIPQWAQDAGSTVGCDIAPAECALIHRAQADGKVFTPGEFRDALSEAIVTHPIQFVGNRVSYVSEQWFADEVGSYFHQKTDYKTGPVSYSSSNNLNPGQGLLYLVLLIAAIVAAFKLAARGRWALLIIPLMAMALLAPFAIVHVEVRYLIPLKVIGLLAPILVLMLREQPARSRRSKSAVESIPAGVS
jgi:hypothetical protein